MSSTDNAVERLQQEAADMLERVAEFQIRDMAGLTVACEERNTISDRIKAVIAHHAPIKTAAHNAHSVACQAEKNALKPWKDAQNLLEPKIIQFQEKQRRMEEADRRQAEEIAKQQEETLLEQLVEQAVAAGASDDEVCAVIDRGPPTVAVTTTPRVQKVAGSATIPTYKAEVFDLNALISVVASGRASRNFLQANQPALNKWAAATKGTEKLPGVDVVKGSYIKDTRR